MLLLECAKCSYTVDVEGKKNNFKTFHECNGAVSLTKVSQMCIYKLLLNSFPTGITCLYSIVLPNAPRIIESPSRGGPKLSGGQAWINNKCNTSCINEVDESSGIFYGFYRGFRLQYSVTGQLKPEANTAAFTVSWRNHFTNLLAVSAYSGHLQYLATGDKVFKSTYILTRKGTHRSWL